MVVWNATITSKGSQIRAVALASERALQPVDAIEVERMILTELTRAPCVQFRT